jgi:hypothetical protein
LFLLLFIVGFPVVEDPVPHDEQARDDHAGDEAGPGEAPVMMGGVSSALTLN